MTRKERPLKGGGNDVVDYRDFIDALLRGDIQATALIETTRVSDGVRQLAKLEYEEPVRGQGKGDAVAAAPDAKQT